MKYENNWGGNLKEEQYEDEFIGWKLEDLSEILFSISGIEIPEDPISDWSEPHNGNILTQFLEKEFKMNLAWTFAIPNPRCHLGPFGELGTLLVGIEVNRASLEPEKLNSIYSFHKKLLSIDKNITNPMYVVITDIEYGTVVAPWWN